MKENHDYHNGNLMSFRKGSLLEKWVYGKDTAYKVQTAVGTETNWTLDSVDASKPMSLNDLFLSESIEGH